MQQEVRALGSRYQLERLLGSGAMGQVWLARDLRAKGDKDKVAAKLLREEYANDAQIVTRFVQERSILLDLKHPHIVAVRDLVVDGGDLGIVMDLVEGEDLRSALTKAGTLRPAEACRITADVLEALAAAHAKSVLHRDVKPDNVLLDTADPPYVRLTDFGIARLAEATTVRMTGVLGTAQYIAPEVFTVEQVSPAADVYGAGVMLYELLVGRTPFAGSGTDYAVAYRHVTVAPPRIPDAPREVWGLLDRMLAKDPGSRPSATEASVALRALLPELADVAPLAPMPAPEWTDAAAMRTTVRADDGQIRDANATILKGDKPDEEAAPSGPEVGRQAGAALTPAALDPEAVSSGTILRDASQDRTSPVDLPEERAAAKAKPKWRRYAVWGAVGVVVAGGVGTGVFFLVHHTSKPKPTPVTTSDTIQGAAEQHAVPYLQMQITRTATYDTKNRTLTLTIQYAGSNATLAGPFFEAVPAQTPNAPCPTPSWSSDAPATQDTTTGIDPTACGWSIPVTSVAKDQTAQASYTIPWSPPAKTDTTTALGAYATAEQVATDDALDALTTSTAYPVQRLAGVVGHISSPPSVGQVIGLVVYPQWQQPDGASPYTDSGDQLYDVQHPTGTDLATELGGLKPPVSSNCQGSVSGSGGIPHAASVSPAGVSCTFDLVVGGSESESDGFTISAASGGTG